MTEQEMINQIHTLQEEYGILNTQLQILNGSIWGYNGFAGRQAMNLLKQGACYLPDKDTTDTYGNIIPARKHIQKGCWGTLEFCNKFWEDPENWIEMSSEYQSNTRSFEDPIKEDKSSLIDDIVSEVFSDTSVTNWIREEDLEVVKEKLIEVLNAKLGGA